MTGLVGTRDRVSGVRLGVDTLTADLVVDASGRAAGQADRWLTGLGLPAPEVSVISIDLGYTTAVYRRRAGDLPGAGMTFVVPQPPREKRFGVAVPVEGDRWLISLGGWHGEHAPPDPAGFAAFARDLPYPSVADLIDGTERIGDAAFYRFPATRRRHLERLRGHPDGYLALGDSLCSFNPVYGQGMTSAVQQALALGRALDRHRGTGSAVRTAYYRGAGAAIATPWQFAAGGDFLYPETGGRRPPGVNLFNRYAMRINRAIPHAPDLQVTMAKVQHLLVPASAVLRPAVLFTVLRLGRRRKTPAVLKPSATSP